MTRPTTDQVDGGHVLVSLSREDFLFITTYDPERERSASRRDIVAVIEEIQALIATGAATRCYPQERAS